MLSKRCWIFSAGVWISGLLLLNFRSLISIPMRSSQGRSCCASAKLVRLQGSASALRLFSAFVSATALELFFGRGETLSLYASIQRCNNVGTMLGRLFLERACRRVRTASLRPLARPIAPASYPNGQKRWSSATSEPHQPDAEGSVKGAPSSQKYIPFTAES